MDEQEEMENGMMDEEEIEESGADENQTQVPWESSRWDDFELIFAEIANKTRLSQTQMSSKE